MTKAKAKAQPPKKPLSAEVKALRKAQAAKARSAKTASSHRKSTAEERHERFAQEYAIDQNAKQAAIRAGYSPHSAQVQGCQLLTHPRVKFRVAELLEEAKKRAQINADWLRKDWETVASVDATQLSQFRRKCCPGCWESLSEEDRKAKVLAREIDPECVNCLGEGRGYVYIPDTRTLTPEQKRVYIGVKQGKDGIEVKLRDIDKAQERLAKLENMDKQVVEHTGEVKVTQTVTLYEFPRNGTEPKPDPSEDGQA